MNDRALTTTGVPRPGTAVAPRSVAQAASFSIILSLSFCHLLNDLMQSLVPALYPILKSSYGLSFGQIGVITLTRGNRNDVAQLIPLLDAVLST